MTMLLGCEDTFELKIKCCAWHLNHVIKLVFCCCLLQKKCHSFNLIAKTCWTPQTEHVTQQKWFKLKHRLRHHHQPLQTTPPPTQSAENALKNIFGAQRTANTSTVWMKAVLSCWHFLWFFTLLYHRYKTKCSVLHAGNDHFQHNSIQQVRRPHF